MLVSLRSSGGSWALRGTLGILLGLRRAGLDGCDLRMAGDLCLGTRPFKFTDAGVLAAIILLFRCLRFFGWAFAVGLGVQNSERVGVGGC